MPHMHPRSPSRPLKGIGFHQTLLFLGGIFLILPKLGTLIFNGLGLSGYECIILQGSQGL